MPKIIRGGIEYIGSDPALSDLRDVSISTPSNDDVLKYDSTADEWVNGQVSNVSSLDDLTNVTITTPTDGQILKYDGTNQEWINASGGGSSADHITLTQAEYDALVQAGTVDPTAFYFISDAVFPSYAHDYSTNEQIVGTWIDGSPIYEKTFPVTYTNFTVGFRWFDPNVSIDKLLNADFYTADAYGTYQYCGLPCALNISTGDVGICNNYTGTLGDGSGYLTIRYTKSSSLGDIWEN